MELLALFSICLIWLFGWILLRWVAPGAVAAEDRLYFAPALGLVAVAAVAFVASHTHDLLIPAALLLVAGLAVRALLDPARGRIRPDSLLLFTGLAFAGLFIMQFLLLNLWQLMRPGSDEIWTIYHATGVSPPDQMFSWHQALFAAEKRTYPESPFYGTSDLFDRPHLAGYAALFFFKLFQLPLTENAWQYPAGSLRFYHCFCWLVNNLYLFGVALLFRRLAGSAGALLATATTALSGLFLLTNFGGWMKFGSTYPILLAFALFLQGRAPVLQAILCAAAFHLHSSVLPFLLGFGALQIGRAFFPLAGGRTPWRHVLIFATVCALFIGGWFALTRAVEARQSLFAFYLYDTSMKEAETVPRPELARRFHARHTAESLGRLPGRNIAISLYPAHFWRQWQLDHSLLTRVSSLLFQTELRTVPATAGAITLPFVLAGVLLALRRPRAGLIALTLYLAPTLFIGVLYRIPAIFSLHIMVPYHALALFGWVWFWRELRFRGALFALPLLALNGLLCVLFARLRFVGVEPLPFSQFSGLAWGIVALYLAVVTSITAVAWWLLGREKSPAEIPAVRRGWLAVAGKLLVGVAVSAVVLGLNALFYRVTF